MWCWVWNIELKSKPIMEKREQMQDLISNLPYDMLQHIVSTIPYKEAIKTSVLSTKWRKIWIPTEVNLEFDSHQITSSCATQKLNQIMGSLMNSSSTPNSMKLYLANPRSVFLVARKCVDEELHLEFFLQENVVTRWLNLVSENGSLSPKPNMFSSLKTLNLKSITHLAKKYVSSLFSDCLFLESLKIEKCSGVENMKIEANSSLKKFVVVDCPNIVSISICAPNLKTFWYQGVLAIIELKSTPQLVDVVLDLRDGSGNMEFDIEDLLSFFASLKDIQTLTLSGWLIEYMCTLGVKFGKLEFKLNKLKELCWIDSSITRHKRDSLLCFLQISTSLEKLLLNVDENYPSITLPFPHQYWHEPHLWMDYEMVKSNLPQFINLKFINIMGFKQEQEDDLLLLDLLLYKSFALKEMSVSTSNSLDDSNSWFVSKIPKSHLSRVVNGHPMRKVLSCSTIECFFLLTRQHNL